MSHITYNKEWREAQQALQDLSENEKQPANQKPEKDKVAFFQFIATMYIKYIQIMRKLEVCYDQIVHPQKRLVLRNVLDGVTGRVLELKQEMVTLECLEYHFFDDILSDLKLTPNDVEMPIPKYYVLEQEKNLRARQQLLGQVLARMGPGDKDDKAAEIKMSLEEAIRLIQVHERARQGRLRAKFMREIREQEEKNRQDATRGAPTLDPVDAAVRIQKLWRGILTRRRAAKHREEELQWLGMNPPPQFLSAKKSQAQVKASKVQDDRRVTQATHRQEFEQALVTVKEKLRETEGPDMKETMQDQIRQWFLECRDATGKFPDYPEGEEGSAELFKEKLVSDLEKEIQEKEEGGGKDKKGKKSAKGKKGKDKKGKKSGKGKGKKGKGDDDDDEGLKLEPSKFTDDIGRAAQEYENIWKHRDESDNFQQKHDVELIKEEKRVEVEREIRQQVDELMKQELRNLKMAVDKEKAKKKGKKSGKKKKGKKGKKSGKKGKKGKKEKDLTPDKTIEELFEELVMNGIIKKVPRVNMEDYEGEYNYLGSTLRQADVEPMPSLADVRRTVTELACLPLGSDFVHKNAPLVKSLLLAGPSGVGKKMLVHAICTETGANLFDLSATNLAGKYPGKDGLKMLMHLIFKVGRALQPSVFLIDDADKMFKKKLPKGDISDPKRLKKELPKAMKGVKGDDRLLLIGCSRSPWDAELKPFCSLYQRILLIPRPDYASRHLIWRRLLAKQGGIVSGSLDVSTLAKVTDGNTMGQIKLCCEEILTERRLSQMAKRPLTTQEFIPVIARRDFVHAEEEEAFKKWYEKTPLGKKRARAMAADEEEAQGGGKGKGKGKKSGKKGKKK